MQQFGAAAFYMLARAMETFIKAGLLGSKDENATKDMVAQDSKNLLLVAGDCERIGLRLSAKYARDLSETITEGITLGERGRKFEILQDRIQDEIEMELFLHIPADKAKFFNTTQECFGKLVAEKFPSANYDIAESSNCLALQRSTACVFHLMRVMEVGLKSLSKTLGIPYAPSWESHLKQINDRIAIKHKKKGVRWKRDESFFKDIAGDLTAVKTAWRNPTMHIVRIYTPEEAEDIFRAVRTFMQKLANRISEVD